MRRPGTKPVGVVLATALVGALAVAAAAYGRPAATTAPNATGAATVISCARPTIGFLAPLTGDAASIGQETRNWARYAVQVFNARSPRVKGQLAIQDTRLPDTAQARLAAQRLASNARVAAVVGPAGSQEVIASAPIMRRAGLVMISGSATRTALTIGPQRLANFLRVVPNDGVQGPTIARYLRQPLNARRVMVVDDQTAYGQPLANSIAANSPCRRRHRRPRVGEHGRRVRLLGARQPGGQRHAVRRPRVAARGEGEHLRPAGARAG